MSDDPILALAKPLIERHEGRRHVPYRDAFGRMTIGVGLDLDSGLHDPEIDFLYYSRAATALNDVQAFIGPLAWSDLTLPRIIALLDMAYSLGRLRMVAFGDLRDAITRRDYNGAAARIRDLSWHNQIGQRSSDLAHIMEKGILPT